MSENCINTNFFNSELSSTHWSRTCLSRCTRPSCLGSRCFAEGLFVCWQTNFQKRKAQRGAVRWSVIVLDMCAAGAGAELGL